MPGIIICTRRAYLTYHVSPMKGDDAMKSKKGEKYRMHLPVVYLSCMDVPYLGM